MVFLQEKKHFLQKNAFSYRKMQFPTAKCSLLQRNAAFLGGTWQEAAGNCRRVSGSSIKNASQLSTQKNTPRRRSGQGSGRCVRGFEKGLAGGGWQQTNPQKGPKKFSRNVSPFSYGGIGKKVHTKRPESLDFLAPTPSVRQPLFETSLSVDPRFAAGLPFPVPQNLGTSSIFGDRDRGGFEKRNES